MNSKYFKFSGIFLYMIFTFSACKDNTSTKNADKIISTDSITNANKYPAEIIQKHLEKKYDNAAWLYYILNYTKDISCVYFKNGKRSHAEDSMKLASFDLNAVSIKAEGVTIKTEDDTIEILFFLRHALDTCDCIYNKNIITDCYGFSKESDIPIYGYPYGFKTKHEYFNPIKDKIETRDSLFRLYVKLHREELSPTLLRLCKEKNAL